MADNPVTGQSGSTNGNEDVFAQLRRLAEISHQIEQHARMQASAYNFVQAGEIKRRIDELTENQNRLIMDIVGRHPDSGVRDRFVKLAHKIDDYRPQIKSCEDPEELKKLRKEIDEAVDDWIYQFQTIVSEIVGVKPPDQPIQGESPF
ncbi:MAG: hypothetical protein ACI38Q_00070 [Candidatus Bruticola sp.]